MDGTIDFRIPGHRIIYEILTGHLDRTLLKDTDARWGGGTLSSMRHGEYRESADIDFLLCESRPFGTVKSHVYSITDLGLIREPVVEKDAVRLWVAYADKTIKVEFIQEQRFTFGEPECFCGINVLNDIDLMACKLFAYSDRSIYATRPGKDISDILAIFKDRPDVMVPACRIVYEAYGSWFTKALKRLFAIEQYPPKGIMASADISCQCMDILSETIPRFRTEVNRIIQDIEKQEILER